MPHLGVHADLERFQKRWILGALGIALIFHLALAWVLTGPFTVKSIEITPDAFKSQQNDPIAKLPVAEPPRNPAEFNLDPNLVEKALQTPQPVLAAPSLPEPNKVIASTDLTQTVPFTASDSAKITTEIARVEPAASGGPVTSSKLAQDLINANSGPAQEGLPSGAQSTGNGTKGTLPGFAELAPDFKGASPNLSNLPDPVLLRLPSDVLFDFDSATLKPEADTLLGQAVGLITKYPQADVQIDGYSDSIGRSDYNLTLSEQRAQAVQAWLQQHIAPSAYKFRSQGHGSSNYIVSAQGSIQQQQPNRRVEILIQALKP
jgi:OOP family OmpA-OmpF porin